MWRRKRRRRPGDWMITSSRPLPDRGTSAAALVLSQPLPLASQSRMECGNCELRQRQFYCENCLKQQ